MKNISRIAKFFTAVFIAAIIFNVWVFSGSRPKQAEAQLAIPVGGAFLPGMFDIFTPTLCGPIVNVVGPRPGGYIFAAVTYRHFPYVFPHVATNMVGLAVISPPCPPTLTMLGSSLGPGPE